MLVACGAGGDTPPADTAELYFALDSRPPPPDFGQQCTLGLPNSCASCSDVCPGVDNERTQRICEDKACNIACKAHYYDVDGDAQNGCEAEDDLPLHDTPEAARDLGDISAWDDGGGTTSAVIPSDERPHLEPPATRATGIADYYRFHITDDWGIVGPYVRVDAAAIKPEVALDVWVRFRCDSDGVEFVDTAQVSGLQSETIELDISCDGGDDGGEVLIKVEKQGTGHTADLYLIVYHG